MKYLNLIRSALYEYRYELWLTAIILLLFWPFTFHVYIPKWDSLDAYLPYRYIVSDSIRNGHFPLWHSFSYLGVPTYSDMQSGAWTPFVWIVSLFGHYGIGALIIEVLLCYILASIGMFRLTDYLIKDKNIAFITAIAYGLSGFMINSCHLMVFLLGVAWLPWILYFLICLLRTPNLKYAILLSLCVAINITSASPALTILLIYFLSAFLIWYFSTNDQARLNWKKTALHIGISSILVILLILPFINAFYEFFPYFSRIRKIDLAEFLLNPFTPKDYLTLIWPYMTVAREGLFHNTDASTANTYFGIFGLFSLFVSTFLIKKRVVIPALIGVFILIILAWGIESGVYEYFAKFPGIGVFKHTYLYMTYVIFIALLLSAFVLKRIQENPKLNKLIIVLGIFLFVLNAIAFIICMQYVEPWEIKKAMTGVLQFVEKSEFSATLHLALNAFLWCTILTFLFFLNKVFKIPLIKLVYLGILIEFTVLSYWIAPTTVYNKIDYAPTANYFDNLPQEPSQEFNTTPLQFLNENSDIPTTYGIWRNVSVFQQRPAYNGSNPTRFKRYDYANDNGFLPQILEHPILYLKNIHDTLNCRIDNSSIKRNAFEISVTNETNAPVELVLNQNYHHLWKAYFNSEELPITLTDNVVMGVNIPANTSGKVVFRFESPMTTITAIIALLTYLTCIGYLIFQKVKRPVSTVTNTQ